MRSDGRVARRNRGRRGVTVPKDAGTGGLRAAIAAAAKSAGKAAG
jgi:hypothetical protein